MTAPALSEGVVILTVITLTSLSSLLNKQERITSSRDVCLIRVWLPVTEILQIKFIFKFYLNNWLLNLQFIVSCHAAMVFSVLYKYIAASSYISTSRAPCEAMSIITNTYPHVAWIVPDSLCNCRTPVSFTGPDKGMSEKRSCRYSISFIKREY